MFSTALPNAAMLRANQTAKTKTPVAVANNLSVAIFPAVIRGLAASVRYIGTLEVRVTIYRAGNAAAARLDLVQDVDITTDPSGVATCTFLHTSIVDRTRVAAMTSAQISIAATAGGVTVTAYQATGVECLSTCTVRLIDLEPRT